MTIDAIEPSDLEVQPPVGGTFSTEEEPAPSESSPDSGDNHEDKPDKVQARINKLTAQRYEAERKAEAAEKRFKDLEASKPAPVVASEAAPVLPDDMYDDEAMRKYHNDTSAYNRKVAEDAGKSAYQKQQDSASQTAQEAAQQESISEFVANAQRDGVDLDKLRSAEKVLVDSGLKPELGQYLLTDPNGAKIAEYLHDNPAEMHEIIGMSPMNAAVKIANEIKAKALSTTPKVSNAPDPIEAINGGGYVEKDDFSRKFPGTTFN